MLNVCHGQECVRHLYMNSACFSSAFLLLIWWGGGDLETCSLSFIYLGKNIFLFSFGYYGLFKLDFQVAYHITKKPEGNANFANIKGNIFPSLVILHFPGTTKPYVLSS